MELVIISDTHVKSRAPAIPEWVKQMVESADHVIHAGDFDSRPAYEEIAALADQLTAVAGNMDRALDLPAVATVGLGGVRFVVTHGQGPEDGYRERVLEIVDEHAAETGLTVGISGHTHRVLDTECDGYRLLNPGSATAAWPAQEATLFTATVSEGTLSVDIHRETD
ncbi:MAG: metallophosphoesterase family protein [Natronomonas sp.]